MGTSIPLIQRIDQVIINPLISLLFTAALVVFFWGVVEYISGKANGSADQKKGQNHMLWGVVGMFIMVSVYGLIGFITATITSLIS